MLSKRATRVMVCALSVGVIATKAAAVDTILGHDQGSYGTTLVDNPSEEPIKEEYRFLAAQCQTPAGDRGAIVLLHRLFEDDTPALASVAREAIGKVPQCRLLGDSGFVDLKRAQDVAGRDPLVLALLPGPIVDFGPPLTPDTEAKENIPWTVGYDNQTLDQSPGTLTKVLAPISAVLGGSWRCFSIHDAYVSKGIVAHDIQSCGFDQSAGVFTHWTVRPQVYSIESRSGFFGGDSAARRALAAEMTKQLSDWLRE